MRHLFVFPKTFRDWFGCFVTASILFVAITVSIWLAIRLWSLFIMWIVNNA